MNSVITIIYPDMLKNFNHNTRNNEVPEIQKTWKGLKKDN